MKNDTENVMKIIAFQIGTDHLGIELNKINRILAISDNLEITNAPSPNVAGMLNLGNDIVPIIDIHQKLQISSRTNNSTHLIIFTSKDTLMAFPVDLLEDLFTIPSSCLSLLPPVVRCQNTEYIQQVAKLDEILILILDTDKLFCDIPD